MKNKKQEILDELVNSKEMSTSKVARSVNINYWDAINLLEELLSEGKVRKIYRLKGQFWRLL